MRPSRKLLVGLAALSLFAAACGDTNETDEGAAPHDEEAGTFSFGEPASAEAASRVIEIEASDDLTFSPDNVDVAAGDTVTFRVSNTGKLPHDFTLGDAEHQDEHGEEMAAMTEDMMMGMEDEPNAFVLPAGETKELTWHFTEAGSVLFGCHVPGHYAAGMHGDIVVE